LKSPATNAEDAIVLSSGSEVDGSVESAVDRAHRESQE
jgi:hypothetical protein